MVLTAKPITMVPIKPIAKITIFIFLESRVSTDRAIIAHINEIEKNFILRLIPFSSANCLTNLPKTLLDTSQLYHLSELFAKKDAERRTKGVVGSPLTTMPRHPTPREKNPSTIYTLFISIFPHQKFIINNTNTAGSYSIDNTFFIIYLPVCSTLILIKYKYEQKFIHPPPGEAVISSFSTSG
jgi:hypothetical protein